MKRDSASSRQMIGFSLHSDVSDSDVRATLNAAHHAIPTLKRHAPRFPYRVQGVWIFTAMNPCRRSMIGGLDGGLYTRTGPKPTLVRMRGVCDAKRDELCRANSCG